MNDLRIAVRQLVKQPGFTLAAVVTLAVGIGANSLIFSAVNAVFLQPYPFPEADRIMRIYETNLARGWAYNMASPNNFLDWRQQSESFEAMAAYVQRDANFSTGRFAERILLLQASASLFDVLATPPVLGGAYRQGNEVTGRDGLLVISHAFWHSHLGGDPSALGREVSIDGTPHAIIGILPPDVDFPSPAVQAYKPIVLTDEREGRYISVAGRLKQGVARSQAEEELRGIARRLAQAYPESNKDWTVSLAGLGELRGRSVRQPLLIVWLTTALLLLIACVNLANLLLSRAAAREREVSIRMALGAGRWRVIRQLLTESLLLALLGGAAGLALAAGGGGLLSSWAADAIPRAEAIEADGFVAAFTFLLTLLAGLLFGAIPALRSSKVDLESALREGSRGSSGGGRGLRSGLIVAEVALAFIVLAGAGLLLRSLDQLMRVDPGFAPDNLTALRIEPPMAPIQDGQSFQSYFEDMQKQRRRMNSFYGRLLENIEALPGVASAAAVNEAPLNSRWSTTFNVEGRGEVENNQRPLAVWRVATPGYFETMRIPLLRGRTLRASDGFDGERVVVIDRALAERAWPGEDPIGQRIALRDVFWYRVVGVVGDVSHRGLRQEAGSTLYTTLAQSIFGHFGDWGMDLIVRSEAGAPSPAAAVRREVGRLDPALPVFRVRSGHEILARDAARERFQALLLGGFAAMALVLSGVGIFGVVSYSTARRRHEIGIRRALGAQRADIYRRVLAQGLLPTTAGLALGLAGAWGLGRLLEGMLYRISPSDPPTLALACLALALLALTACLLPARRASRVDPLVALRYE